MAVYVAYLDVSGKTVGSPTYVLSGVVAREDDWFRFGVRWHLYCRYAGIDYLHMTDFVARVRQYASLKERERRIAMNGMLTCLKEYTNTSFSRTIDDFMMDELRSATSTNVRPLVFCGADVIAAVKAWLHKRNRRKGRRDQIRFVFDRAEEDIGLLLNVIDEDVSFGDSRELPGLQAADFLAWELGKHRRQQRETEAQGRRIMKARATMGGAFEHLPGRDNWLVWRGRQYGFRPLVARLPK